MHALAQFVSSQQFVLELFIVAVPTNTENSNFFHCVFFFVIKAIVYVSVETGLGHPGQPGHALSGQTRFKNYPGLTRIG